MKKMPLFPLLIAILICIVLVAISILLRFDSRDIDKDNVVGWGDNIGGRASYTSDEIDKLQSEGKWGDKIVFNSISDGVIGDEKNFVGAREYVASGDANISDYWNGNEITVENGKIYTIRAFVHNNSPLDYDGDSENTKVAFNLPEDSATSIPVHGFIFSDNASPSEYWDGVLLKNDKPFHLEYLYGSALLENSGIGKNGGIPLSDEIVTKASSNNGTLVGYDALDGKIPGGLQYACYVSIKVMVVFDTDFTVQQQVRLTGDTEWKESVEDAEVGDTLEFRIQYKNIGDRTQSDVMIKNILPENLQYVEGSTKLYNGNFPDGATYTTDTLMTTGINIGHYSPNANAFVRFEAVIVDESLGLESNTLVNWSQAGVGPETIQDYATVVVYKTG